MENVCNGCGEKYNNCVCEELDAEMNEGKYLDDDPNDGDYLIYNISDSVLHTNSVGGLVFEGRPIIKQLGE